jgi:hypothetical protein
MIFRPVGGPKRQLRGDKDEKDLIFLQFGSLAHR